MSSIGHTHYRCGFDLQPLGTTSWGEIIKPIRSWISHLNPGAIGLGGRWFYTGGDWKNSTSTKTHVHVRVCIGKGTDTAPTYWGLRFENPCNEFAHRLWITDIGLTHLDSGTYRFILHLYHRLNPNYVGREPSMPVPTAPKVVSSLFRTKKFTPIAGSLPLTEAPLLLSIGEGDTFRDLLADPNRLAPVVLVTSLHETGKPLIDPVTTAKKLIGNAVVFVSESRDVDEELDYLLGRDFRCRDGMVRIFQPRVKLGTDDSKRHRFFLKDYIQAEGVNAIYEQLTAALNRRALRWIGHGCESIEDVESETRRNRLAVLLTAASDDQTKEMLSLYEEENGQLIKERGDAKRRIDELELAVDQQVEQLQGASFRERQARDEADFAHDRARIAEARIQAIGEISSLPTSVSEVVSLIERLHADRLIFTKQAIKSAKETVFPDNTACWSCLWAMATVLYDLHFSEELAAGDIERRFKEQTGFDLVMREGKQTKADSRLMGLRRVVHAEKEYDITPHAKLRSRNVDLRIHYAADRDKHCLVIGHCGEHLETYGTRRRKEG